MDVQIDISAKFEKDLKQLSSRDKEIVSKKLNNLIDIIKSGQSTRNMLYRLHKVAPLGNLESSMYVLKVNISLRIILLFEEDPLFDTNVLTLLRVIHHSNLDKTFNSIQESLLQSYLTERGEANG